MSNHITTTTISGNIYDKELYDACILALSRFTDKTPTREGKEEVLDALYGPIFDYTTRQVANPDPELQSELDYQKSLRKHLEAESTARREVLELALNSMAQAFTKQITDLCN